MAKMYDGRHFSSIANSGAKCLIENWFEERSTHCLDDDGKNDAKRTTKAHKGLITIPCDHKILDLTTINEAYRPLEMSSRATKTRRQAMERMFCKQAEQEVENLKHKSIEQANSLEPRKDFMERCVCPQAEMHRPEYVYDCPITFWSQNFQSIQGVTEIKSNSSSPFRRSAAFSTPTDLSWEASSTQLQMFT